MRNINIVLVSIITYTIIAFIVYISVSSNNRQNISSDLDNLDYVQIEYNDELYIDKIVKRK